MVEKLLAVSGSYGADNTEYRTEIDTFNKVISNGTVGSGPETFKVWTKGGQILEYGYTSDSALDIDGHILIWAVNKVTDRAGNSYTITYVNDTTNNNIVPDQIDYTENGASLTSDKYIKFTYATRTDTIGKLVANKGISLDKRLTQITNGEGTTDRKIYKFTYQDRGTDPALLDYLEECYYDATQTEQCLPQTDFTWQESQGTLQLGPLQNIGPKTNQINYMADFNGDGLDDRIAFDRATNPGQTKNIYLHLSDGTTFGSPTLIGTYVPPTNSCECTKSHPFTGSCLEYYCSIANTAFGDFNRDGKSDLIYRIGHANYVRLSNGSTLGSAQYWSTFSAVTDIEYVNQSRVADIDGDGYDDFLYQLGGALYAGFSTGTSFSHIYMGSLASCPWPSCIDAVLDDVDGDGRADLTHFREILTTTSVRVFKRPSIS